MTKEINKKVEEKVSELVRDFTKVHPMPKSEARRLLNELLEVERQYILEGIERKKEETREETGAFKYDFIYDRITKLIK